MDKVIDSIWFELRGIPFLSLQLGIVAVETFPQKEIKLYIGVSPGIEMKKDEELIAKIGVPFPKNTVTWLQKYCK